MYLVTFLFLVYLCRNIGVRGTE